MTLKYASCLLPPVDVCRPTRFRRRHSVSLVAPGNNHGSVCRGEVFPTPLDILPYLRAVGNWNIQQIVTSLKHHATLLQKFRLLGAGLPLIHSTFQFSYYVNGFQSFQNYI
jgi:hypothetical protein